MTRSLFALLLAASSVYGQQDFNNFNNIQASGDIPTDFTTNAFRKIEDDLHTGELKLKGEKEKVFLEGVHYAINDLLHSGIVVYGDEVSQYVNEIADKLLEKDEPLRKKLRFYTIKSNETNAFSTYQGIIFVTTGLISQLSNEAQLAYVLSHEIIHYKEEHVVETFDYKTKGQRNREKIHALSNFSRENEFEADKLGVKLYYDAGYSKDQLISTFDVLLYSYLPFEEAEFSKAALNNSLLTIPEGFYPEVKYPIKASEDTDDSKSSHPNIKKRKEAVQKELENYKDWDNKVYLFGKERFEYIRTLCRFESVRTDIVDAEFDDALYSIFILEKQYPNSIYLKRMKAKAWLGYAQYKSTGDFSKKIPHTNKLEGEIATFQCMLKNLNKVQAMTVSMRKIEDIRKEQPEDVIIQAIWDKMVKTLAENEKFQVDKYSRKTYETALNEFLSANKKDTVQKTAVNTENLSKYEKIKKQSNPDNVMAFDTSAFYLYAISDLLDYKAFNDKYSTCKDEFDQEKADAEAYDNLSYREKRKRQREEAKNSDKLGLTSMIYLEPVIFSYNRKGINRIKSEKLQVDYTKSVEEVSAELGMSVKVLSTSNLVNSGTEAFNQRSVLMSYMSELTDNEEIEVFPTDYSLLLDIKEKNGTSKVMLSVFEHVRDVEINGSIVYLSIIIFPIAMIYYPITFMQANHTDITFLILDIDNGDLVIRNNYQDQAPVSKYSVKNRVYNIFHTIKTSK
ncbi:MAG: M48 family metallopeptidase [Bacteroidota bacterium]